MGQAHMTPALAKRGIGSARATEQYPVARERQGGGPQPSASGPQTGTPKSQPITGTS
jgi:hypothetical protein